MIWGARGRGGRGRGRRGCRRRRRRRFPSKGGGVVEGVFDLALEGSEVAATSLEGLPLIQSMVPVGGRGRRGGRIGVPLPKLSPSISGRKTTSKPRPWLCVDGHDLDAAGEGGLGEGVAFEEGGGSTARSPPARGGGRAGGRLRDLLDAEFAKGGRGGRAARRWAHQVAKCSRVIALRRGCGGGRRRGRRSRARPGRSRGRGGVRAR